MLYQAVEKHPSASVRSSFVIAKNDVPARCSATSRKHGNLIKDCFISFAMTPLLDTLSC
jgi:hypothetical protein